MTTDERLSQSLGAGELIEANRWPLSRPLMIGAIRPVVEVYFRTSSSAVYRGRWRRGRRDFGFHTKQSLRAKVRDTALHMDRNSKTEGKASSATSASIGVKRSTCQTGGPIDAS